MRVLVVKLSSLGDLIHCLPALSDAREWDPGIRFDWVAEEAFAEIPALHRAVDRVIPAAIRRWRGRWRAARASGAPQAFLGELRSRPYDLVIDAQGLLKSALVARLARGPVAGFDFHSAREPLAALSYGHRYPVPRDLHAVTRLRLLFAAALGRPRPDTPPDFGLMLRGGRRRSTEDRGQKVVSLRDALLSSRQSPPRGGFATRPYLVFLHATTWPSKAWPVERWAELGRTARAAGYRVLLPWHAPTERLQAEAILAQAEGLEILPRQGLREMAGWLGSAAAVVAVDTGLAHLAAALGTPGVGLYGASDPRLTGAMGEDQLRLATDLPCVPCRKRQCSHPEARPGRPPCLDRLPAEQVWSALSRFLTVDRKVF